MNTETLGFTINATGNRTIILNGSFTPKELEFEIGPRTGTNETDIRKSTGFTDTVNSYAIALTNGSTTRESTTYCIMHYQGTTKKFSASFVSVGAGQFVLNFDVVDATYTIRGKARG